MSTLLVGLGSPFENDQLGWLIIDELEKTKQLSEVSLFKSKSDGSDWYHHIKNHHQIIFIDAALTKEPGGAIIELTIDDLKNIPDKCKKSTHSISLADSISMAKNLNLLKIPVRIIAISTGNETINMTDFFPVFFDKLKDII